MVCTRGDRGTSLVVVVDGRWRIVEVGTSVGVGGSASEKQIRRRGDLCGIKR